MRQSDTTRDAGHFPSPCLRPRERRLGSKLMAATLAGVLMGGPVTAWPQQPSPQPPQDAAKQSGPGTFTMKMQSEIVLTNVVVRDKKTGDVVKGLKASDFTILENGKPQQIASFDYQNVDEAATLKERSTVSGVSNK